MKRNIFIVLLSLLLAVLLIVPAIALGNSAKSNQTPARKIVMFKKNVSEEMQEKLITKAGGKIIKKLSIIRGAAVLVDQETEAMLENMPEVQTIENDKIVHASAIKTQPNQSIPWGVTIIGAKQAWNIVNESTVSVAVIDTGIDLTHPDLAANIKGGYNAIYPYKSAKDDNGHGTHVAGIIAAIDNSIEVVGVANQVQLYAVKVLNAAGYGYLSDVIEGIQWCTNRNLDSNPNNNINVINMSLGSSSPDDSEEAAIKAAYNAGIVIVAAAGNNYGGAVDYPAAYPEVIAVSATDKYDNISYFSSIGPEVNFAAPGYNIYSTYKGSSYKTLSGTSMATPHVAATAALVIASPIGSWDVDLDGVWDPSEVENKLKVTAVDIGAYGHDIYYGHGRIDAYNAVTKQ